MWSDGVRLRCGVKRRGKSHEFIENGERPGFNNIQNNARCGDNASNNGYPRKLNAAYTMILATLNITKATNNQTQIPKSKAERLLCLHKHTQPITHTHTHT